MSKTTNSSQAKASHGPPLQPLRIPTGWTVRWNTFFDIEPKFRSYDKNSWHFGEDMLLLVNEHRGVAIDLGWYPSHRANGSFMLRAIRHVNDGSHEDGNHPLKKLRTRSKLRTVKTVERWLQWFSDNPPPLKQRTRTKSPKNE